MKFLFDLFPVILFFIAYKTYDIFVATGVAIVASIVQTAIFWIKNHRFENMHLITLGLVSVLGGMTILFHDPVFIMWKVTAVNWLFALVFVGSQFVGKKTIIQRMMDGQISLPKNVWLRLNNLWAGFFVFVGSINVLFAKEAVDARDAFMSQADLSNETVITDLVCNQEYQGALVDLCTQAQALESTWVNFKLFGVMGLTLVFVIVQASYLAKHIKTEDLEKNKQDNMEA
jgi:intracellular septation protein